MDQKLRNKFGKNKRYTVYDNKTDFPICVYESAKRCAEVMGVKIQTFYYSVNKRRGDRWHIIVHDKDEEGEE